MNDSLKFLLLLFLLNPLVGCGTNNAESNPGAKNEEEAIETSADILPVMSLNYEGSKYEFNRVIPKEEIDISEIVYTGTYTGSGDRVKHGKEILFYKKDNSVFIIDDEGKIEEWVNFTKNEK